MTWLLSPLVLRLVGAVLITGALWGGYVAWRAGIRADERQRIELEARRDQERRIRDATDAARDVPYSGPELDEWLCRRRKAC